MMTITATEFKTNFGKYLKLVDKEDIFITRNGKTIAKVVNPNVSALSSLRGMLNGCQNQAVWDAPSKARRERLASADHV